MPEFKYRAVKPDGEMIAGSITSESIEQVRLNIKNRGLIPIEIQAVHVHERTESFKIPFSFREKKLDLRELSNFCRQLSVIISSGINTVWGFETIASQTKNKLMKAEVNRLLNCVQTGMTMSDAMLEKGSYFPELLGGMVATGEATGTLDAILKSMASFYSKENYYRQKVKAAAVYPIIISLMAVGMVVFFLTFVIPKMLEIIKSTGGELPLLTRIVIGISDLIKNHFIIIGLALLALITLTKTILKTQKGKLFKDTVITKIPVIKDLVRNFTTMRFSRTMYLFVSSGYPILQGLEFIKKNVNNSIAEMAINGAVEGLKRGEGIAENLDKYNYFDKIMVQMIAVGEQTGDLQAIVQEMAEFYEQEAETSISKAINLTEPIMLIVIGSIAGLLILSVAVPMLTVFNHIG
ncbi:MAG TPA: type II secretion system F family protein [Clostridia bacterium]